MDKAKQLIVSSDVLFTFAKGHIVSYLGFLHSGTRQCNLAAGVHHICAARVLTMKKAAVKKQRKTSMLASGSMAVGIVEMPDLEPALEAPLANALAGCALLCRYGNHQPAGS